MADRTVQRTLEAQAVELHALQRAGIFTPAELKRVISQRRNFEYSVLGSMRSRATWERYLEYELQLEALRTLRAKRLGVNMSDSQAGPAMRRLHQLYQRATKDCSSDVSLWLQWAQFAKEKGSTNVLSKSIARALLLHPLESPLWIVAAEWEFAHNANMVAARTLMLRGLRANDTSLELWREYLRLELVYLAKVRTRLSLVQSSAPPLAAPSAEDVLALELPQAEHGEEEGEEGSQENGAAPDDAVAQAEAEAVSSIPNSAFVKGATVQAVFDSMLAHPTLLVHRVTEAFAMLQLARELEAPAELLSGMLAALKARFAASREYWLLAGRELGTPAERQSLLDEAAAHLGPTDVAELTLQLLSDWPDTVLERCLAAEEAGAATPFVYCMWMALLSSTGALERATQVGTRAVAAWPADADVWMHVLTAHVARLRAGARRVTFGTVWEQVERALQQVGTGDKSFPLRSLAVRFVFAAPPEQQLPDSVQRVHDVVAPTASHEHLSRLAELALQCAFASWAPDACRELVAMLLEVAPSLAVFSAAIAWETEPQLKRDLFHDCTERFADDAAQVWLDWTRFEEAQLNVEEAGRVHWRARRSLRGAALTRYLELASAK